MTKTSNKEDKPDFFDIKDKIIKSPITKILLVGIGALAIIGISGYVFKLINFTAGNFKQLKNTIKGN